MSPEEIAMEMERRQRDLGGMSAGAYQNLQNSHAPKQQQTRGVGGSGQGAPDAKSSLWAALIEAGADPGTVGQFASMSGDSGPTGSLGRDDMWRKLFANDHWKAHGIGGGQSTGSTGGAMMMPTTPQGQGTGPTNPDRLDYEAFRDRNRRLADQRAEMDLHQKFAQQLFGSLGIGGQVHSSGTSQEIFNNAGRPLPVTLNSTQTRDITPQEKASLLQAILGGM